MAKVLSIVLGQTITRIAEVDYKTKTPKVYKCIEIATPEDTYEDGYVKDAKVLTDDIKRALKDAGIKTKKVVYSIASGRIASREATFPYVKQNKLDEIVEATASDYFPVDISEFKVTYQIVDTPVEADGTKKYRVSLMIAPNDLLDSYTELSKNCGFDTLAIDYLQNSVNTVLKNTLHSGVNMVMNIRDNSSQLFIFDEDTVALSRTVPVGFHEALKWVIGLEEAEDEGPVNIKKVFKRLRTEEILNEDILRDLGNPILRVMDYYNSRNIDRQIENVYLTGAGENFVGFIEYLSDMLGVAVKKLSEIDNGIEFGAEENPGAFIANVGAAIESIDLLIDTQAEKKKRKSGGKKDPEAANGTKYLIRGIAVLLICLIASGILSFIALSKYSGEKKINNDLKKQEADLVAIIPVYKENLQTSMLKEEMDKVYFSTETQNDNLAKFFEELERILPTNVNVLSFSADQTGVSINMNVDSKEASAKVIDEFRQFGSLTDIRVASVTEETDDLGISNVVNFTIEANYAPVVMVEEEE